MIIFTGSLIAAFFISIAIMLFIITSILGVTFDACQKANEALSSKSDKKSGKIKFVPPQEKYITGSYGRQILNPKRLP